MSSIRRKTLLSLLTAACLAIAASSASAATFAPAGDQFKLTATSIKFDQLLGGPNEFNIRCDNTSLGGTLASPASGTATILASKVLFGNGPTGQGNCPIYVGQNGPLPQTSAKITASGDWQLKAISSTQVDLVNSLAQLAVFGQLECKGTIQPSTVAQAGSWSNAKSTLTFTSAPKLNTQGYGMCAQPFWVTVTYQAQNLTHPGTPITVVP